MANIELDISQKLELFENINKAANIGIFQFEVETENIYWNEVLRSIYEVSADYEPALENVFNFIKEPKLQIQIENAHLEAIDFGKSFELEHEILTGKGNNRYTRVICQPVFKEGKCVYLHGTVMDITVQKKSEFELAKKNQQLILSEQMAQIGYWRWDTAKNEETWSDNLFKIFGRKKGGKLTYETYMEYVHPDDTNYVINKIEDAFFNKTLSAFSHRIILENGTTKTILLAGQVITNEKEEVIEMAGTCQDITEDKVKEQQRMLHNIQQGISERMTMAGSWQWNPTNQKFKWSDNLYQILGFDQEKEITFDYYLSCIHPDDVDFVRSKTQQIIETKESIEFSHRVILEDGSQRILEIEAEPIINTKGEIEIIIGSTQDVTLKLNTEQNLREKNQLLDFAEKLTTIGYWKYNPKTNCVFWSENLYQMFEQSKEEELSFESYFNRIHPDDQEFVNEKINQSISDNKFYDFTHRILLNSGEIKIIQVIGKVLQNNNDNPLELLGICVDITESETKELELAQKNQQLRIAEKMTMIGNWQYNPITNKVLWSDNLYNIYGLDKSEPVTFETYVDYVHEDDKCDVISKLKAGMRDGKFHGAIYRIQLKDGTVKTLKSIGKIITNKNGDVLEMFGTCQDITESKQNELELLHKNQQLNLAEQMASLGSWEWQPNIGIYKWSENLYRIYGWEPGVEISHELTLSRIHPKDFVAVTQYVSEILGGADPKHFTHRIILDDGDIRTLEIRGSSFKSKDGNIELVGTTQDITESKNNELQLLQKNQKLNEAEQMAKSGSFHFKPIYEEFLWSDNSYRIHGFEIGIPMNFDTFLTCIHPNDFENLKNHRIEIITSKVFKDIIYRIKLKNGSIRTIKAIGKVITNNTGEIVEIIGTSRDITEQKRVENKILETNTRLENMTIELTARNRQLADFNQITSHNLRAPVSNLSSLLELYNDSTDENLKTVLFSKFGIVIDHLTLTLNTLIDSLKIKNIENLIKQELSFDDTLNKTKEILVAEILKTGAIIRSDFSNNPIISYNEIYLESIFLNLISNAIKYKSPDRIPEINIISKSENGKTMLTIKDNGLGIDLERHGHKLFGLNKVFHKHPDALGIGLFLTKAQIEAMGGSIYAESEVNIGTTFYLTLN